MRDRLSVLRELPGTLYSAVVMELFERLAYYGMVLVLSIYMVDHLGVPSDLYGVIYSLFTGALYLLPLFAGALADRFGYKPALAVAFATLTAGYALLGSTRQVGLICVALGLIAAGGSIVKPTISGTVTRTTEEGSTRPLGFGLYYMTINAGGLIGPVLAAQIRNRAEFRYVFLVSAAACALMLLQALSLYREPVSASERRSGKSLATVMAEVVEVLANWRFVLLLVIFSGFWAMINVLFGFMPLFVEHFTDLTPVETAVNRILPLGHWLNPEVFISLDALLIVLFQAAVSYLTRRWPTLRAMLVGTEGATTPWVFPAPSPPPCFFGLGIFVLSLGEMTCSARFFEYCGTIAPPDRVAVYLGYSFLSIFLGNLYSGFWAGSLYHRFIEAPLAAGSQARPAIFFAGVAAMGVLSVAGLAAYRRWVAPQREAGATGAEV